MTVSIIVAVSENHVIGFQNKMPWHLPAELKYFKELTMGVPIIMGRKTFEANGGVLPGRLNIVITRQQNYSPEGVVVYGSLDEALKACADYQNIFIIGGSEVYKEALSRKLVDIVYLTRVHATVEGDAFFQPLQLADWERVSQRPVAADAKNVYAYTLETYIFKPNLRANVPLQAARKPAMQY